MIDRRRLFGVTGAVATLQLLGAAGATRAEKSANPKTPAWGQGVEGQRRADLGDGTYLNPIVAGDHPDPTILKDGEVYYMTFSSFLSYPGLVIWRSTDLVNWAPVGPALSKNLGDVWAVDLAKHDDRYFIYIPANPTGDGWSIYVIWADDIAGPWSDPIDLGVRGCIDPGHIVGEDGRRYLFVNGIRKIQLTDDGLATAGELEPAYSPWMYPEDWVTENFAPEGPKLLRRGDWFYLVTAVGGTAGPVTGHMVIAARSRSVHGPWEHCPHNPLVRTLSTDEPWWSKGHATLVEGPAGDWWMVYHGYENGFRTLGRQTLLEPIEWTADGWFKAMGGDLSRPLPKPRVWEASTAGVALSDDFSRDRMGTQWSFHQPGADDAARISRVEGGLRLQGRGLSPADSSPLVCLVGDRAYAVEIGLELTGEAEAGLLLFYNHKAFVGLGFDGDMIKSYQYAEEQTWARMPVSARRMRLRIENQDNVVTYRYSTDDGATWIRHPTRMEVSGLNHNVFGGFLSLRPALYCAGSGAVRLTDFSYSATAVTAA
ncbi:xylosidase [Brevundimonas intermedia]|uniref:Xylosidase n=1 Tax=Brevundimonas intermedia TaxID=74315 RepID=A0ABQ5T641_9CAUL|nr:family 43 glycosylhydrolase [Brevundimonas intermedia]GLK48047.1 xylosidase [Brevundimonas intermedia]